MADRSVGSSLPKAKPATNRGVIFLSVILQLGGALTFQPHTFYQGQDKGSARPKGPRDQGTATAEGQIFQGTSQSFQPYCT